MPLSETILVIMGLLALAMVAAGVCRNLPIPDTVFLVLLGMLLAWLAQRVPQFEALQEFSLTPDLVFFVFLPALIFESALNLDARQLMKDIGPIMVLAVIALLISTAIIGLGVWKILGVELVVALLFGALIAATDPVAVVALFKELGAPVRLMTLVEGESLFNDATAIVLFHILLGIVATASGFGVADVGPAIVEFLRVFFGGIAVGAVVGFGISELMRRIDSGHMAILVMSLVMAYVSFVTAEHLLHVSGVMAAVSAALAMGAYGVTRIPPSAMKLTYETWEVIALICNSLLFLMVGLSVDVGVVADLFLEIIVVSLLVIAARALSVYSFVPITTRLFKLPVVNMGERHIMWWGGLKGGLAIAIVLSIPDDLPGKQFLVQLTLGVVMFTLLVNAPTIRPLIRFLGIDRLTEEEQAELRRGLIAGRTEAHTMIESLHSAELISEGSYSALAERLESTFEVQAAERIQRAGLRHAHLEALRIELDELEHLFEIGLIKEYTYLDLRATLRRDREHWMEPDAQDVNVQRRLNPFHRLEQALIRRFREVNWAAPLLAYYQGLRISQRLQRDIAGIITSSIVVQQVLEHPELDPEHRKAVAEVYRDRRDRRKDRVEQIQREFPSFYENFEHRLYAGAALENALHKIEEEHHSGDLGAKAYILIERRIEEAIHHLPALSSATSELKPSDLIKRVPMFSGLSEEALQHLAARAQQVTFLPDDVVIGQDDRGNALYIIMQGAVSVHRREAGREEKKLADLTVGDFFGEAALLGDDVRTASVRAQTPLTLLRLTRRDVIELAQENAEFDRHLREANAQRS